jgi:hypothetical protein
MLCVNALKDVDCRPKYISIESKNVLVGAFTRTLGAPRPDGEPKETFHLALENEPIFSRRRSPR